jgi:hypothetical protein
MEKKFTSTTNAKYADVLARNGKKTINGSLSTLKMEELV